METIEESISQIARLSTGTRDKSHNRKLRLPFDIYRIVTQLQNAVHSRSERLSRLIETGSLLSMKYIR